MTKTVRMTVSCRNREDVVQFVDALLRSEESGSILTMTIKRLPSGESSAFVVTLRSEDTSL